MNSLRCAIAALLLAAPILQAQTPLVVHLEARDSADYYPWIERLLAAPTEWAVNDQGKDAGVQWRLVVLRAEVHASLYLERITLGEEGCCKRLDLVRTFQIERVGRHFGMRREISRFDNLVAVGPRAFRFELERVPLMLTVTSVDSVRIERVAAPRE